MPAPLWLISSCGWRFRQCKYSNSNAVARSLTNHRDSGSIFYTHMYEGRCFPAKCILAELVSWQLVMAFCMGNWTGEPESCVGNTTLLFPWMQPPFCVAKSEQCNELHEIPVGGKTRHTKAPSSPQYWTDWRNLAYCFVQGKQCLRMRQTCLAAQGTRPDGTPALGRRVVLHSDWGDLMGAMYGTWNTPRAAARVYIDVWCSCTSD